MFRCFLKRTAEKTAIRRNTGVHLALSAIDPVDDIMVSLFNPRKDVWQDHFVLVDLHIEGRTPTGRATVSLLRLNAADRLEIREQLALHDKIDRRK